MWATAKLVPTKRVIYWCLGCLTLGLACLFSLRTALLVPGRLPLPVQSPEVVLWCALWTAYAACYKVVETIWKSKVLLASCKYTEPVQALWSVIDVMRVALPLRARTARLAGTPDNSTNQGFIDMHWCPWGIYCGNRNAHALNDIICHWSRSLEKRRKLKDQKFDVHGSCVSEECCVWWCCWSCCSCWSSKLCRGC